MRFLMHSSTAATNPFLAAKTYDLCIKGEAIDDRGRAAHDFALKRTSNHIIAEYNPSELVINLDGVPYTTDKFQDWLNQEAQSFSNGILIESTTLSFPEIFLSLAALLESTVKIDFLYVEPGDYTKKKDESPQGKSKAILKKEGFDLSEKYGEFIGIPGAAISMDDSIKRGVFFLGYEDYRFDRIFEEFDGEHPAQICPVVFGVPPFQPGWEVNSFSANIRVMTGRAMKNDVYFCPANNPLATYQLLEEHYGSLSQGEKMFVAPLGTKPASIGIAAFVAEKGLTGNDPLIGIIYDHPQKKEGRSENVFKWHLYEVIR